MSIFHWLFTKNAAEIQKLSEKVRLLESNLSDCPSVSELEEIIQLYSQIIELGDWHAYGPLALVYYDLLSARLNWRVTITPQYIAALPDQQKALILSDADLGMTAITRFLDRGGLQIEGRPTKNLRKVLDRFRTWSDAATNPRPIGKSSEHSSPNGLA